MNYYVECTWCDGFEYPEECAYCGGSGYRLFGSVPEDDVIDYEAAAAPMKLYEAFVYTGGAVHPQTYIRIVKGLIGEIVRAAMRLDGEAKEATELVEPDRKTIQLVADALEIYEGQDFSEPAARWSAAVDVLAALGIGDWRESQ